MKIEVLCSINSGMYNIGDVIDLPKKKAKQLIDAGLARFPKKHSRITEPREIQRIIPKKPKTKNNTKIDEV